MPLNLFYTMVQKSQKWPKTQIKGGGPALTKLSRLQKWAFFSWKGSNKNGVACNMLERKHWRVPSFFTRKSMYVQLFSSKL